LNRSCPLAEHEAGRWIRFRDDSFGALALQSSSPELGDSFRPDRLINDYTENYDYDYDPIQIQGTPL
jgi:hypothetical protein